ncbi:MAG: hypothetical protein Q8P39_00055 [Candidatus Yanofskybacteria bacterium]|nr:hypothetical protein [Candidatus Yanofskybacteria bacterium]
MNPRVFLVLALLFFAGGIFIWQQGWFSAEEAEEKTFDQILSPSPFLEELDSEEPEQEDPRADLQAEPRGMGVAQLSEPPTFFVKPYLVYPADMLMYPAYEAAVTEYLMELQQWYLGQVGAAFQMASLVVLRHPSRNYLEMRCGENPSQECIRDRSLLEGNWAQYMNEAIHGGVARYESGGPHWADHTAYLVFGAGGGGYAGANAKGHEGGWAVVGDWVLEPISGVANEWGIPCSYSSGWQCEDGVSKGTPAHELGHAFGLPHPGEEYRDSTIMEWHGGYPEVGFLDQEREFLRVSPFFVL